MAFLHPKASASKFGMVKIVSGDTAEDSASKASANGYPSLDGNSEVVQVPANPELKAISGLSSAADKLAYFTGSGAASLADFSASGRSLVAASSAIDQRDVLELGQNDSPTFQGMTLSAALSLGNAKITNLATPTSDSDAASKSYVDSVASGLVLKDPAKAATTAALPSVTYANGSSGVGATLTADANGALASQDGVSVLQNDRLLVKNQAAQSQNGLYFVKLIGDGANPFVLERVLDFDSADQIESSSFVFIEQGTSFADTGWVMSQDAAMTVGTTAITWVQFSSAGVVIGGNGLTKTGNTLDVVGGDGLSVSADSMAIDLHAVPGLEFNGGKIRAKVTGAIVLDGSGNIAVALDSDGGLEDIGSGLEVKIEANKALAKSANGMAVVVDGQGIELSAGGLTLEIDGSTLAKSASGIKVDTDGIGSTEVDLSQDYLFTGKLKSGGRLKLISSIKTTGYTAQLTDHVILVDPTSGAFNLDLPSAASSSGVEFIIKHASDSGNDVTIDPNGTETIEGVSNQPISARASITILCDGSAWHIV
jgi:hypothetical protein